SLSGRTRYEHLGPAPASHMSFGGQGLDSMVAPLNPPQQLGVGRAASTEGHDTLDPHLLRDADKAVLEKALGPVGEGEASLVVADGLGAEKQAIAARDDDR